MAKKKNNRELLEAMRAEPGPALVHVITLPKKYKDWIDGPTLEPARSKGVKVRKLIDFWLENH